MAESRRFSLTPQLDIDQILKEAQKRWLRPPEICEILRNYRKFRIAPEPANRPPSGSLFLFDRKVLRYFRKDGHNWRKKKDGKTVNEAHERLKVGSVDVLHCYYAHGEENENFQRRSYWMLEGEYMHIVLVHYLEIKGSKASYIRTREAEENAQVVHADSPSCSSSFTNPSQPPFPVSDASSPQTSEYEDADSDNYQASSRYHSLLKMQQYGNEPVRDIHLLNSYSQFPPLTNQYAHHRQQPTRPGSEVYSVGQEDATSVFDDTGTGRTFTGCRTQFGSTSWAQVLEHCSDFRSAQLDPIIFSTRDAVLDQQTQNSSTLEEYFADDLGFKQNDIATTQVKSVWQVDNAEVDPLVSHIHGEVNNSMEGNPTYASLIKQLSLDITTEGEGLKKYDSFSRWMSNELGEVADSHLKSNSEVYWSIDDSGISNHEQLDAYLVGPSISQVQLYSIIDFSPHWAYAGMETEVIITGKCLKNKEEVRNCKCSCMFGEIEVPADILADGTLCCCAPPHKSGRVPFYVTCSNRLACSEVREFEYREQSTQYMESFDSYINMVNDMDLHKRLDKLIDMDSFDHSKLASRITNDKQKLIDEINSVMREVDDEINSVIREVDDELFNALKPLHEEALPSDTGAESLVDRLLKDKLHTWLINKVIEDGKGPNVVDKDGQGVIHLAAALGYDWVIKPVVTSGVSVNFRDAHGWTALHWAAFCGRLRTVATLIRLDAASGALTDPTPEFPSGRTPADLASGSGHKGIAGFLAESSLTSYLLALNLKESEGGAVPEVSDLTGVEDIAEPSSLQPFEGDIQDGLSLKDSLSAVRKATQAAARIYQVFRVESFQRKKLAESGDGECGISDERALSLISFKTAKSRQQDLPVHAAATKIQNKFRGWKGRKDFLVIRQRIIKIQAHVRGHQVRKHYKKIVWTVGIMEKIILRWRRKGSGLRGFRSEGLIEGPSMQDEPTKDDEYDFLKEGRKQTELRLEKALARVRSMVQYPEARDQYRRLMTVVNELQETKAGVMEEELESSSGDGDFMIGLEELWEDDTFMPAL